MKSMQFVGSLLVLIGLSAVAQAQVGNEGPQGDEVMPRTVLAEKIVSGGFVAMPETVTLQILVDGSVQKNTQPMYGGGLMTTVQIAQLSQETLAGIIATIGKIQKGTLVDENPSAARCMDVPVVGYFVFDASNAKIETSERTDCHVLSLQTIEAISIQNVLEGLDSLAQ